MNPRTESLIGQLSRDLPPVRPLPRLRVVLLVCVALVVLGVGVHALFGAPVPGLAPVPASHPWFWILLLALAATAVGCTLAALGGAIPGRQGAFRIGMGVALAGGGVAAAVGLAGGLSWATASAAMATTSQCAGRAGLLGVVPALLLCAFLSRAIARRPWVGAGFASVGAIALGSVAVHTSCPNGAVLHAVLGHWLSPVAVALALAVPLGWGVRWLGRAAMNDPASHSASSSAASQ